MFKRLESVDVSGSKVFGVEALFQDESVSGHDGARFLDGVQKKIHIPSGAGVFTTKIL